MNGVRRRLLQAGLALTAAPAWGALSVEAALKAATGPGWATWQGQTPPLTLPDLAGRPVSLSDFQKQVVIVNFWATWCDPCREEIPAMSALASRHNAEGLRFLAVNNAESRQKVQAFLQRWPISGTVLSDRNGTAIKAWNVAGMPANYVLDRNGALRYWHLGALDWESPAVAGPVLKLLLS